MGWFRMDSFNGWYTGNTRGGRRRELGGVKPEISCFVIDAPGPWFSRGEVYNLGKRNHDYQSGNPEWSDSAR